MLIIEKFKSRSIVKKAMQHIYGGRATSANCEQTGVPTSKMINGKEYKVYHYRSWTSDKIEGGSICYFGESYCDDTVAVN